MSKRKRRQALADARQRGFIDGLAKNPQPYDNEDAEMVLARQYGYLEGGEIRASIIAEARRSG